VTTYDSTGGRARVQQLRRDGVWVDHHRHVVVFVRGRRMSDTSFGLSDGSWTVASRVVYDYDACGRLSSKLFQGRTDGAWETSGRDDYHY
jgi:hypothetical protein